MRRLNVFCECDIVTCACFESPLCQLKKKLTKPEVHRSNTGMCCGKPRNQFESFRTRYRFVAIHVVKLRSGRFNVAGIILELCVLYTRIMCPFDLCRTQLRSCWGLRFCSQTVIVLTWYSHVGSNKWFGGTYYLEGGRTRLLSYSQVCSTSQGR